jgi:peroxiredoxin
MTRYLSVIAVGMGLVLGSARAAEVPRKAPELAIQLVNGQQLLLSQYRGKVVLIEFLHTTCPHCQHDSTIIERLYKEYGPRGFQPLGVAFNDNAAMLVPDFIRQLGLTYPVGLAPRDTVTDYLQHPYTEILYVPQMIFVDRKGIIRAQHGGMDDFLKDLETNMRSEIETLLKEPATNPRTRRRPAKSRQSARGAEPAPQS